MPGDMRCMPRSQMYCWPAAHQRQRPHEGMNETEIWSPTANSVTPSPSSVTTPAPSWPPTVGRGAGRVPSKMCSSEWHMPAAVVLTKTSPASGGSSSISSTLQSRVGLSQNGRPSPHASSPLS